MPTHRAETLDEQPHSHALTGPSRSPKPTGFDQLFDSKEATPPLQEQQRAEQTPRRETGEAFLEHLNFEKIVRTPPKNPFPREQLTYLEVSATPFESQEQLKLHLRTQTTTRQMRAPKHYSQPN